MDTPQPSQPQAPATPPKKGYGKRPLWQWILIYVIIGGIVYGAIYYFAVAKKGGYSATNYNANTNSGYSY